MNEDEKDIIETAEVPLMNDIHAEKSLRKVTANAMYRNYLLWFERVHPDSTPLTFKDWLLWARKENIVVPMEHKNACAKEDGRNLNASDLEESELKVERFNKTLAITIISISLLTLLFTIANTVKRK